VRRQNNKNSQEVQLLKFRFFWDIAPCNQFEDDRRFRGSTASIIKAMMEAERTSETSVNFNLTTRRYIPEYSKLYTRRRENLKSQKYSYLFF
jgi:hypothetical protein